MSSYVVETETVNSQDEVELRQIIKEMATMSSSDRPGRKHMHDECVFIRPTGNPLSMQAWDAMMNSEDVTLHGSELVDIHKLHVNGNMAYACYTTHSRFSYKGTDNDDIAVFTGVFERQNSTWKLIHGQRSTGRKPSDAQPNFN